MTIIYAATADQHLIATILPKIAQSNVDMVRLSVSFDTPWDSITNKRAVFTTSLSAKPFEVILSSNGDCLVPYEVLEHPCKLYITVKGTTASGATKATTKLTVKVLEGTPVVIVSDPYSSVYEQLLRMNKVLEARMNIAETGATVDSEVMGIRVGYDGTEYDSAGEAVREQINALSKKLTDQGDRLHYIDGGEGFFREKDFEIGNVSISNSGWDYTKESYSAWRVRSKEGKTFSLEEGDVIRLTDYSHVRCYIGWLNEDGTYGYKDWIDKDYTVKAKGEYIFLLALVTENTSVPKLSTVNDLLDYLTIDKVNANMTLLGKIEAMMDKPASLSIPSPFKVIDINHRGYNSEAPENTLPAFKLSKKNGFDFVETDISWTKDNIPVLLHDESINRTARMESGANLTTTINISDITYFEALTYDFGIWKGGEYAGVKIPKYSEFLSLCRNIGLHPYIEIKGNISEEQAEILIAEAKRANMIDYLTFISFHIKSLQKITAIYPRVRVGYVQSTKEGGWTDDTQLENVKSLQTGLNNVFVDLSITHLDDCITPFIENGIPVEVWCPNTTDEILALDAYVSGVTSDNLIASKVFSDEAMSI